MSSKIEYLAKRGLLGMDAFDHAHSDPTKLQEMFPQAFREPTAEDENVVRPETLRNTAVTALGLPESWKESVADEERWAKGFAEDAAVGAMGSIKKVGASAAKKLTPELAQKLESLIGNPKGLLETNGPVNEGFQKLRDILGHTGPVKIKNSK